VTPFLSAGERCSPSAWGCGAFPLHFIRGSLSSPCTAGKASPAQLEPPPALAQLEGDPQAQLGNHLCTSAATSTAGMVTLAQQDGDPGTAGWVTQSPAGRVSPAHLAGVGLPMASPKSTSSPAGLERGGRGPWAALTVVPGGGLMGVPPLTWGTGGPGRICMRGRRGGGAAEGCNCLGCAQNISCASQIFTQGKTKS